MPTTPVRRQYLEVKARHPDAILFFRLGDFYETFDEDAKIVARALDIVLTGRDMGRGERIPMAGVPYQAAEGYIAKLIGQGHRVALCDQIGDVPARGLVRREVVRVVSPGTLVEDGLLPARANNFLAAIVPERSGAGLAFADVSTGLLAATEVAGPSWRSLLSAEMLRLGPVECLVPGETAEDEAALVDLLPPGARPTPRGPTTFAPHRAAERLRRQFQAGTVASLGFDERPLAARATAALLEYVEETLPSAMALLDRVELYDVAGAMVLDGATRRSLELTAGLRSGGRAGSLLEAIDETRTTMGARLLRHWLTRPLLDADAIHERQDAVNWLVEHRTARGRLGDLLAALPDLERLGGKAAQRSLSPRDMLALAAACRLLPSVRECIVEASDALLGGLRSRLADFDTLADDAERTVEDPPPAQFGEGIVRTGRCQELDEVRTLAGDTRAWIARLERSERERTGVKHLKVGYNRVFGYYLELSRAALSQPTDYYQREATGAASVAEHVERLGYVRKQTLATVERFVTAELQEYELRVRTAQEEIVRLERAVYAELLDAAAAAARPLLDAAGALASLDALTGFAETAVRRGYVRPELVDSDVLEIVAGRHPVVERTLDVDGFVPNDTRLGGEHAVLAVLTGPNMAGKSTYLRQVATIVLVAQIGSYVPAQSVRLGIVDRIFARVGAQDDLAAQRSTFMVEMIETANILRNATPRSLLVLDEIGRGTSTFDGIAVARAVVEHIHDNPRLGCKTLFATHYHELADLADTLERVESLQVEVLERGEHVVFLHRVVPGAADRSYGVHVARLAGVPQPVTSRAMAILAELERERGPARSSLDSSGRVPLDSGANSNGQGGAPTSLPALPSAAECTTLRRLRQLDPLQMTPLEALTELIELTRLLADVPLSGAVTPRPNSVSPLLRDAAARRPSSPDADGAD
ncbi:MAG: DNA mismatch repair protein MutS [Chloroflexi bacterium]|nr:DNA mismatch repair protein MutS [Chloroflexota bacterium]